MSCLVKQYENMLTSVNGSVNSRSQHRGFARRARLQMLRAKRHMFAILRECRGRTGGLLSGGLQLLGVAPVLRRVLLQRRREGVQHRRLLRRREALHDLVEHADEAQSRDLHACGHFAFMEESLLELYTERSCITVARLLKLSDYHSQGGQVDPSVGDGRVLHMALATPSYRDEIRLCAVQHI